jgi:cytoskeletal protein CcmA (bactofilin family)
MATAETRAILGDHTEFTGRMTGRDLTILGHFEGAVELTGVLRVGRDSVVKAQVRAADVEVEGAFEGEIQADRLAFGESARAKGVFTAGRFSMREGALVDGAVNLPPVEAVLEPAADLPVAEPAPVTPVVETAVVETPVAAAAVEALAADTVAAAPTSETPSGDTPSDPDASLAVAS